MGGQQGGGGSHISQQQQLHSHHSAHHQQLQQPGIHSQAQNGTQTVSQQVNEINIYIKDFLLFVRLMV